jgi:hypothetical protein
MAVVTSITIMSSAGSPATGGGLGYGTVSRFVCVHCTLSGKLSSRGLFLARAAVRHISATKSCREAGLGFRKVHVEAWAGDVMAGKVARRGWRRTFDASHQVTQSVVSENKLTIQSY